MNDVTEKYADMIVAFECDFHCAKNLIKPNEIGQPKLRLDIPISKQLLDDIELIEELSFNLRHGFIKIMEVSEQ